MIEVIMEEADIIIKESYEEGYKQATLELKPEVEYWKAKYDKLDNSNFQKYFTIGTLSFGAGLLIGNLSGFYFCLKL